MKNRIQDETSYLAHLKSLWRRQWPDHLPQEQHYPFGEMRLTDYLQERAKRTPEKPCIIFYGEEMTFRQLNDWSERLASYLLASGLTKGDRVAVFLPNCPQFLIAFYGILKAGCVHVPVNPMYKARELLHVLQDVEARALITLDRLWPIVQEVTREHPVPLILTTSLRDFLPEQPAFNVHPDIKEPKRAVPGTFDLMDIVLKENQSLENISPRSKVTVSLDDLAALNYTGGTTGIPKGCMHTQRNMLYTAASAMTFTYPLGEGDVRLTYIPVFWIAGENSGVIYPVFSGVPHILLYRWDPVAVMQAVEQYRVTCLGGVMDNIIELMEHPMRQQYDLRSIRILTVSSFVKKVTPEYRRKWWQISKAVIRETSYGMTETHTSDTFTTGFQEDDMDLKKLPTFCGLPMPGTQFKIVDFETKELLPPGSEGEIAIRTPSLMKGYWRNPEETAKVIRDGWFYTGDIGLIDEDGFLIYRGRKKEMLKVKGMSVFPGEIEAVLGKHPAVEACAVVGRPDPEKGESPVAFVILKPACQGQVNEQSLTEWCREQMASYKVPEVRLMESLPLTTTGKIRKEELKKYVGQSSA